MKVAVHEEHFSKMSKQLKQYAHGYVGVTYVPKNKQQLYWQACIEAERDLGDKANVEHVVNVLASQGEQIQICDISGSWWLEIDTPEDLEKAKKVFAAVA